ncbi:MAG: hypothetical protein IPK19_38460 [Chloroflexi bacterium]|nr:hypothetical protein [Chloroflexota bacterium]
MRLLRSQWMGLALTLIAAVAMVGGIATNASAQAGADPALVMLIGTAFENTLARSSLHVQVQSITERSGGQENAGIQSSSNAAYDLAKSADGWNVSGSRTSSSTTPAGAFESTTELVILDGVVYMKTDGAGQFPGGPGGQGSADGTGAAAEVPTGWFEVSAPTDAAADSGPAGGFRGGLGANDALGTLALPVSAASALAVAELPGDTIDGQAMRVFQVTLDAQAVIDSGASGPVGRRWCRRLCWRLWRRARHRERHRCDSAGPALRRHHGTGRPSQRWLRAGAGRGQYCRDLRRLCRRGGWPGAPDLQRGRRGGRRGRVHVADDLNHRLLRLRRAGNDRGAGGGELKKE